MAMVFFSISKLPKNSLWKSDVEGRIVRAKLVGSCNLIVFEPSSDISALSSQSLVEASRNPGYLNFHKLRTTELKCSCISRRVK